MTAIGAPARRSMGSTDWTEDHLVHNLSEGFRLLGRLEAEGGIERGEAVELAQGAMRCMNGALLKVSEVLEAQARLRSEMASLRQEHAVALRESRDIEVRKDARIAALESEVKTLRTELARAGRCQVCLPAPPDALLRQPLVVRNSGGQYLGVCDTSGSALCICDFLTMLEKADPARMVATSWSAADEGWMLALGLSWPSGKAINYSILVSPVRTPSGNTVTLLAGMTDGDRSVPQEFLLRMFRQIRNLAGE